MGCFMSVNLDRNLKYVNFIQKSDISSRSATSHNSVVNIGRKQTFFCCHIPSLPFFPLRRLKLDLGNGYNTISVLPTVPCSSLSLSSLLFHPSSDLGIGDFLHYPPCVQIPFKASSLAWVLSFALFRACHQFYWNHVKYFRKFVTFTFSLSISLKRSPSI